MYNIRNSGEWKKAKNTAKRISDWNCYLCGRDIPRGVRGDLAVEVDHIIPLVRGGDAYNQENLALTHRICNRLKGAHTAEEVLRKNLAKNAITAMDEIQGSGMNWLEEEGDKSDGEKNSGS